MLGERCQRATLPNQSLLLAIRMAEEVFLIVSIP
jgi:hypothetical protein